MLKNAKNRCFLAQGDPKMVKKWVKNRGQPLCRFWRPEISNFLTTFWHFLGVRNWPPFSLQKRSLFRVFSCKKGKSPFYGIKKSTKILKSIQKGPKNRCFLALFGPFWPKNGHKIGQEVSSTLMPKTSNFLIKLFGCFMAVHHEIPWKTPFLVTFWPFLSKNDEN